MEFILIIMIAATVAVAILFAIRLKKLLGTSDSDEVELDRSNLQSLLSQELSEPSDFDPADDSEEDQPKRPTP